MVDKKIVAIAIVLSVILSTALSYGVVMTVLQVQDALRGPQGELGLVGDRRQVGLGREEYEGDGPRNLNQLVLEPCARSAILHPQYRL